MKAILVDIGWSQMLPLTFAKPISHLLIGIDTIKEKWERHLGTAVESASRTHLAKAFPFELTSENILINAAFIPTPEMVLAINNLQEGEMLSHRGIFLATKANQKKALHICELVSNGSPIELGAFGNRETTFDFSCHLISSPSDIFSLNDDILRQDFAEITKGIKTTDFAKQVLVSGDEIFIHPEAKLSHCVLNAESGPIYIGKNAEIMDGALVRGPFALGESSTLKMGAKIYGATSIGQHSKVGGEVNNSIINDFSNKGHDGFLGNSVIGSWCNLGADTNTSNLKNNYGLIKVWNYDKADFVQTKMQFHGLIMGDHSKSSINTMFNTGTIVGMCTNVFDSGFPTKFIPSFSWGGNGGVETFKLEKAYEASEAMMSRRKIGFTETDREIFRFVSDHDQKYR